MNRIIYKTDEGGVAVIIPTPEALQSHTIMEIAIKDVPAGKPFAIIDEADLPDRSTRNSWIVDEADLTDGVGIESNEFEPDEKAEPIQETGGSAE